MSETFLKGSGQVVATTTFQLLDPSSIYGATSFYYDFFLEGADAAADGIWQIDDSGYTNMTGAAGVAGTGDTEWLRSIEVDATSAGAVRILRNAGTLNYWYAINGGGGGGAFPSILAAEGSSSANTEFFLRAGRIYTIVSDGTHSWEFANVRDAAIGTAGDWTAFTDGAEDGFSFETPSTYRIRLVPTGAVNFTITSVDA